MGMNKKLVSFIKYAFFFGLGISLVWLSIHSLQGNPKELNAFIQSIANANYWLIIPVFFILSLSHILRSLRWRILLEPMGYQPSFANTFFSVMIGYLANMAVPRLGEVLKCTILSKYEKIPVEKIVGTIVAERAFDVLSLGIIFLLAIIFQFDVVFTSFKQVQQMMAGSPDQPMTQTKKITLITIAILAILVVVYFAVTKRLQQFFKNTKRIFLGVWEGLITARKLKQKKLFFLYSASIWSLYLIGTWVGFYATQGTVGLGITQAISCLAFASIGMIITPGGIGAYAFLIAKVLELQEPSIDNSIGYANGTLQWAAQCIIVLFVGLICTILLPWYNKKYKNIL
jgi:uncharacterized protein (TIRG00374 family)